MDNFYPWFPLILTFKSKMKIIVKNPPRSTLYLSVWVHGKTSACTVHVYNRKNIIGAPKLWNNYGAINLLFLSNIAIRGAI